MMAAAAAAALALCGVAQADFFAPGGPNSWDTFAAMTEGPSGVWTYNYSVAPGQRDEFNLLDVAGDWGSQISGSNQWSFADGAGNGSISLDTNVYADGWSPSTYRVGIGGGSSLSWTATGGFLSALGGSDWDNASPQGAMSWNGSYFTLTVNLPDGNYLWKPVVTGSWDSIGTLASNNVNTDDSQFSTGGGNNIVILDVDPARGVVRSTVIPAPAAASVLGVAGLMGLRRRRN